jgi:predicted nicotinamide N-methyase
LARYVLDHPQLVAGKRVLDIGAGSGLVAIAAAMAGASSVLAADIDSFSCAAIHLNAAANQCSVTVTQHDMIGAADNWDIILVGDLFYERPLAERLLAWLTPLGVPALLGDPGRNYFPKERVKRLATYNVQTTRDLEDREIRETGVYRLMGPRD